jgi:hypothetical protein
VNATHHKLMMFWTSVVVIALGVVVTLTMLQPLTAESALIVSKSYSRIHKKHIALEKRLPSSVPNLFKDEAKISPDSLETVDLKIPCGKIDKSTFAHSVIQARLTGLGCSSELDIESTEVRNETNNYSATVFHTNTHAYLTDYITLSQGDNKIRILHVYKNGSKEERSYTIVREAKTSEDI